MPKKGKRSESSRYKDDFEEIKKLGHGNFGSVYHCTHRLDKHAYAVKKIPFDSRDGEAEERALRELVALARLQHDNTIRYYSSWIEQGTFYSQDNQRMSTCLFIQMELCHGNLKEEIANEKLTFETAIYYFAQIVDGLAHIHSKAIIHRDLNPSNIFLDAGKKIKIGDFGLVKILPDVGLSVEASVEVGTPGYIAPEITNLNPKISAKADIYGLGIIFFDLLYPMHSNFARVSLVDGLGKGNFPKDWEYPQFSSLLLEMVAKSPSRRPSAVDILARLSVNGESLKLTIAPSGTSDEKFQKAHCDIELPGDNAQDTSKDMELAEDFNSFAVLMLDDDGNTKA